MRAHRLDGKAVAEHGVVAHLVEPRPGQDEARGKFAVAVAQLDEGADLVQGEEVADPVAELRGDEARIGGEGLHRLARFPAAAILQGLRQVPVIERGEGHDAVGQQFVDQPVVEGQALGVGRPAPLREQARPGDREAVGRHAQRLHQRHVLLVEVIVIVGDVGVGAVADLAGQPGKRVPDGGAAAVLLRGALDLIGRCGRSPAEAFGKSRVPLRLVRLADFLRSREGQCPEGQSRRREPASGETGGRHRTPETRTRVRAPGRGRCREKLVIESQPSSARAGP